MNSAWIVENLTDNILRVTLRGAIARLWRLASTFLEKKRSASPPNMSARFSLSLQLGRLA